MNRSPEQEALWREALRTTNAVSQQQSLACTGVLDWRDQLSEPYVEFREMVRARLRCYAAGVDPSTGKVIR